MASKRNPTHVANGEEYSRAKPGKEIKKSTLAQPARREREQILKQSTAVSGKENTQPQVGKEISKSSMGQRARREREQILKQSTMVSGKENTQPQVGKEISKSSMGQRARRERERILKQSTAPQTEQHLLRDTRTQPLQEINVGVPLDEHCANIVNNVRNREDTRMADTIAQTRQKSSYADKGKGLLTYAKEKETSLHAREYNATNAFTSLGATLDPRVLTGRGPTSFTIHGELRHRAGSLLPPQGKEASYAQLYIYDPAPALEVRSRRNQHLRKDVLQTIQETLLQVNPFVEKFRQAHAILDQLGVAGQTLPAHLHYSSSKDRRRYNLPTADEIAVVIPGDGTKACGMRDIILHLRGDNQLMQINECHPAYLPLHYVLLFPRGELGWEPDMKQWDVKNDRPAAERLTQMEFYSHRLFERDTEYSTILRGGKLFQEFLVDAWAATEQNRLTYYKLNQARLRTSLYHDLADIGPDGLNPDQIGQRMVLPSSFTGGPRHMFEIFQDSMAITRYNHHPDIFLTMTANPKWSKYLLPYCLIKPLLTVLIWLPVFSS
ncbi:hypothetical protein RHMOL_Rhmol13G0247700 [Rhododendron molle]|uniref:Uncharacterized protein n=3 Tax=Rhododendron molle TaxID=49168 RepID=A0ACC0LBD7_RHOML|nr:hypothetical protein RHMOL_Rhmol13G0247700 [Rhododendron molle]KAI8525661.1 hypothetical protein RHMOL_Rhmol13G0247700 [Rhododendron molle]KAI8525662.1 hypothetical protein RHMOL_Rhmol13G0247700 [Rhododendron molle]